MSRYRLFMLLIVLVALPAGAQGRTIEGKVVHVSDGDTMVVIDDRRRRLVVRLQAIDAPEKQNDKWPGQAYAEQSRLNLARLVRGKRVRLTSSGSDDYGRTVARVWINGDDAGQAQICAGYAWVFERFVTELPVEAQQQYRMCEQKARNEQSGLWQDANPVAPWTWRHRRD